MLLPCYEILRFVAGKFFALLLVGVLVSACSREGEAGADRAYSAGDKRSVQSADGSYSTDDQRHRVTALIGGGKGRSKVLDSKNLNSDGTFGENPTPVTDEEIGAIPPGWLAAQSDGVRRAIAEREFVWVLKKDQGLTLGVKPENEAAASWPDARVLQKPLPWFHNERVTYGNTHQPGLRVTF